MREIRIRPSGLSSYADCPRRQIARLLPDLIRECGYTLRETVPSIGAVIGTSVHAGAERTLRHKIVTQSLAPFDEVEDAAMMSYRSGLMTGVTYSTDTPDRSTGEKQVRRMTRVYQDLVAPAVTPTSLEVRLTAPLARQENDQARFEISGQYDSMTLEPGSLRDLKTGARLPVPTAQIGAYSLLLRTSGSPVQRLFVDYVPRVSIRKEQPGPRTMEYDRIESERDAWSAIEAMRRDINRFMQDGDPRSFLANPMSSLCSDRFCPAWGTKWCTVHRAAMRNPGASR